MKLDRDGREFIEKNEGLKLTAYKDSGGVWTIGVGHVSKHVHKGMVISKQDADRLFAHDVEWAEQAVNDLVSVNITQHQFTALTDFTFNLGRGALHGSTLLRKLNAGDIAGAANEFKKWMHVNGREDEGVRARRKRDKDLFLA